MGRRRDHFFFPHRLWHWVRVFIHATRIPFGCNSIDRHGTDCTQQGPFLDSLSFTLPCRHLCPSLLVSLWNAGKLTEILPPPTRAADVVPVSLRSLCSCLIAVIIDPYPARRPLFLGRIIITRAGSHSGCHRQLPWWALVALRLWVCSVVDAGVDLALRRIRPAHALSAFSTRRPLFSF